VLTAIRVGVAVAALAATLGVAGCGADSDATAGVAGRHAGSPYIERDGHGWMPSRPRPRSVIWAVGDGADGGAASRAVAAMVGDHRVSRLLYLGDVYESGTAAEFQRNYAPAYARFVRLTAPTIGNHEWPNLRTGYVPYWTAVRGSPPPLWYAFGASGWQLISLNSNTPTDSAQGAWLRRKIRRTPRYGTCRIAFMHHPVFSAGLHGDTPALSGLFAELRGHAAIVISGHDHDMQRVRPVDGITQLVDGAGGRSLYPVNRADPRIAFFDDTHHGALRLKLRPGRAVGSFVAADGTTLDRSSVSCRQD